LEAGSLALTVYHQKTQLVSDELRGSRQLNDNYTFRSANNQTELSGLPLLSQIPVMAGKFSWQPVES
jgi:hypothetical protein